MASRVRTAGYRLATPIERLIPARRGLPPAHLRAYYYRTLSPARFARACGMVTLELTSRGLRPEHRVLDIGSGIGNLAHGLIGYLQGGYDGVEIHPEAVAWCQRAITPRHPAFRFHRADLASRAYNPDGVVSAAEYRFPFPGGTFDFVFLSSVFTHMWPAEVEHYLHEISRVLVAGGVCVASYFLLNEETRRGIDRGLSFKSFDVADPSGLCRLHDAVVPEAAVALDEPFVRRAHEAAGLTIRDIRRGQWWNGVQDDQDLLTVVKGHLDA